MNMNPNEMAFRLATPEDRDQILSVHRDAFGEEGEIISSLVAEMLDDPTAEPIHSFVAMQGDAIVAHVLFTAVWIETRDVSAQILAPLAVASGHQKTGLGTKLVNEAITQLESQGVALVFVLGYPDYYSRFGFAPAGAQGFDAPYPILPKNADAWMVKELQPGAIESNEGTVRCCTALDQPQYWQE
ncbi:GNAT family N-acetyltransferase [Crateriforma spongiae]|uniref:GNAT family N-acetyltransferase n=1 Tax=Crateriforma spongiae TaxID=2724528 RepID=UPI001F1B374B|nr:N-acetyltransferase [Crateriforma spongiae]